MRVSIRASRRTYSSPPAGLSPSLAAHLLRNVSGAAAT
jgi:hypothetical protein